MKIVLPRLVTVAALITSHVSVAVVTDYNSPFFQSYSFCNLKFERIYATSIVELKKVILEQTIKQF